MIRKKTGKKISVRPDWVAKDPVIDMKKGTWPSFKSVVGHVLTNTTTDTGNKHVFVPLSDVLKQDELNELMHQAANYFYTEELIIKENLAEINHMTSLASISDERFATSDEDIIPMEDTIKEDSAKAPLSDQDTETESSADDNPENEALKTDKEIRSWVRSEGSRIVKSISGNEALAEADIEGGDFDVLD